MTPIEVMARVGDAFESAGVPYAVGGALAYAYWGVARATQDVDVNMFLEPSEARAGFEALQGAGFEIDVEAAVQQAQDRGDAKAYLDSVRVDIFVSSIPLHRSAAKRTIELPFGERAMPILSAEDITVLKLLFYRGKDTLDIERLLQVHTNLDHGYVRRWLVDTVGENDERVTWWDERAES